MSGANLVSLTLERFKSYEKAIKIPLKPLTVILGKNNGGKSSIIQALLLLKQTLMLPRAEVPLRFEPYVNAFSLRDLTFGWPERGDTVKGPKIGLEWLSVVNINRALEEALSPKLESLISMVPAIGWLQRRDHSLTLRTRMTLEFAELDGRTALTQVVVEHVAKGDASVRFTVSGSEGVDGTSTIRWDGEKARSLGVEFDHFIPYLTIDRRNVGPRAMARARHNAFLILFAQPLEDLKSLLTNFGYLGAMRHPPELLYRPGSVPPEDIGVSGELAAEMLRSRRREIVHYPLPVQADGDTMAFSEEIRAAPLEVAVNEVMNALGVEGELSVEDIQNVGFKLLFGQATLPHVGRGVSYLMPVVELGLLSDPLRFKPAPTASREEYLAACASFTHCAIEEGEAHLHPKVQSRLAQWLVALARTNRRILIETHSDHLVRRLRGLIARAPSGSTAEKWLTDNVVLLSVIQGKDGRSDIRKSVLQRDGSLEEWPSEFMDEATDEESRIYGARIAKLRAAEAPQRRTKQDGALLQHDEGPEPETER